MKFGSLDFIEVAKTQNLIATPALDAITTYALEDYVLVSEIDSSLADTAAFCEAYNIDLDVSANCVVLEAKRGEKVWYCACIILASNKADVNGIIRRELDAKKISFAPMDTATSLTKMQFGGITPIGLPSEWRILVDSAVVKHDKVIIGSGVRGSKLLVDSQVFNMLPNVSIQDITKAQ